MRRAALTVAAVVAAALALASASPAEASSGEIRSVTTSGGHVSVVFSVSDLPVASTLTARDVRLALNGRYVPVDVRRVTVASTQPSPSHRRVMLAIDTSGSMQGVGIASARAAAGAFLAAVPTDVEVGISTFADRAVVVLAPTRDRVAAGAALRRLSAAGQTSLYDGVIGAVAALGRTDSRTLLILSDGDDTASAATLARAVAAVRRADVTVDAVAFRTKGTVDTALQQLAAAGHGLLRTARDGEQLASAFRTVARNETAQFVVTTATPTGLAGKQVTLALTATVAGHQVSDDTIAILPPLTQLAVPAGPPAAAPYSGVWASSRAMPLALTAVFLGLLALLTLGLGALARTQDDGVKTRRLLARYTLRAPRRAEGSPEEGPSQVPDSAVVRSAVELAGRLTRRRGLEERMTDRLDRAAVPLRANEWLVMQFVLGFGVLVVLVALGGDLVVSLAIGSVTGVIAPSAWLRAKAERRRQRFQEQLPEALMLLAGSLRTGYSLAQALDALAQNGDGPLQVEVGRALAEARLGVPVEDALERLADRMCCEDFAWTVMAIRVQREVGGNLAEVLTTTSSTMRERARLRRQVQVLSAEGRLSAYILIGLPIVMGTYMFLFRRTYVAPLYSTGLGLVMLTSAVVLVVLGALTMRKMIQVEV